MQLYPSLYPNFGLGRGRCNQHLPSRVLSTFYSLVFYWLYGLFVIMSELGKNQISVVCSSISRLLQEKPVSKRPAHFFSSRFFSLSASKIGTLLSSSPFYLVHFIFSFLSVLERCLITQESSIIRVLHLSFLSEYSPTTTLAPKIPFKSISLIFCI